MTVRVDAVSYIRERHSRVGRSPRFSAAPIDYVVDAVARRRRINRDRISVEALADATGQVGAGTLESPGRALIGTLEDTQDVIVRIVWDREVSARTLDRSVDHLHSCRIGDSGRRSERNRDLANGGRAGQRAVSRQLGRNNRCEAVKRLSPTCATVG